MASSEEQPFPVGIEYNCVTDLKHCLDTSTVTYGFDTCIVPIAHPLFRRELINSKFKNKSGPFTRSDIILVGYDWGLVYGHLSTYIDCDSSDETFRRLSEAVFLQELQYAQHLTLLAVIYSIHGPNNSNLARLLQSRFLKTSSQQFWVRIPLQCPSVAANYYRNNVNPDTPEPDTWQWWNKLRLVANSEKNIAVALEIGPDLPDEEVLTRWLGEPIRAVIIPTSIFLTNKRGYPVLSRPHQAFVRSLTAINNCKMFITGVSRHENIANYRKYIEHLARRSSAADPLFHYVQGYEDFLQFPLQPLSDNLESQTYEVFEKDPVKYKYYQDAIYYALLDRVPLHEVDTNVQVLCIAGAGRGPLIGAALNASKNSDRKVRVYAIEKNHNAFVTLLAQKEEIWGDSVTLFNSDMRTCEFPEKIDILISELLGSFGDNELSPECLDGIQHILKDDGISIPSSYSSHITPIQSMRLFSELRNFKDFSKKHHFVQYETPYVVHQKNRYYMSDVQTLFTFVHPNKEEVIDNSRYKPLTFRIKSDSVVHGFSGFFSAVLYKDITLSILPDSHTSGMFSWFPIYFPIREPINVNSGDELVAHFWRCVNPKRVWYEWCISDPYPISIHNPLGRSYKISLH